MSAKVNVNITPTGVLVVAGIVGVGYLWTQRGAIIKAAEQVAAKVNPLDPENVAYQGASAVVRSVTGDQTATVGTWLYDLKAKWFPSAADKEIARMLQPAVNQQILDANDARARQGLGDPAPADSPAARAQVWIGLAALGFALYSHTQNKGRHRGG